MFPFPQAPTGGRGGMTANQVQQPMLQGGGAQQSMPAMMPPISPMDGRGGGMQQPMMPQGGMQAPPQPMAPGLGMQQNPPISDGRGGVDPQQLALLRLLLQQQEHPTGNLRALLGL